MEVTLITSMKKPRVRTAVALAGLLMAVAIGGLVARVAASRFFREVSAVPDVQVHLPADRLFTVLGIPVTNTLLSCWLATMLVIVLLGAARWRARLVPRGLQNAVETLLDWLLEFVIGIAGKDRAPRLFAISATFFLFILANALVALLPFYGPLVAVLKGGSEVPLLRGAGSDINMPLALAIAAGVVVEASGLAALRASYFRRFFRVRDLLRGRLMIGLADLFAGFLEAGTELFRVFSFSFRLFGSLTAGEILIVVASFLAPLILPVPFYGLELLIAVVQAWIFASLTVVFAVHAMTPEAPALPEAEDA